MATGPEARADLASETPETPVTLAATAPALNLHDPYLPVYG
jgi:hypothetical protein